MKSNKKINLSLEKWGQVNSLFEEVNKQPVQSRLSYLENHTESEEVKEEVKLLLSASEKSRSFLETPVSKKLVRLLHEVPTSKTLKEGDRIGGFEIKRALGKGSFATVYLANEILLNRKVALTVSNLETHEPQTLAQLEHENIVRVFSAYKDLDSSLNLLCMQYVRGKTLWELFEVLDYLQSNIPINGSVVKRCISNGKKSSTASDFDKLDALELAIWIGIKLAEALEYAHLNNILHLDIKPGNILLSETGKPLLADFNISFRRESDAESLPKNFGGTKDYMSPEQRAVFHAKDKAAVFSEVNEQSDIYSLGVVLKKFLSKTLRDPKLTAIQGTQVALILNCATASHKKHRFTSAERFKVALLSEFESHRIRKQLPQNQSFRPMQRFIKAHPLISLSIAGAIPQIVGTVTGTAYNSVRIMSYLTPEQLQIFRDTNLIYTPINYLIAVSAWAFLVFRMVPLFKEPERFVLNPDRIKAYRQLTLSLPLWGFAITTFGWFPGMVIFPWAISQGGPLPPHTILHFVASFLFSWGISFSYSYVIQEYLVLTKIYPYTLQSVPHFFETTAGELKNIPKRIAACLLICTLLPLFMSIFILAFGFKNTTSVEYQMSSSLIIALLALSILGICFSAFFGKIFAQVFLGLKLKKD